MPAKDHKVRISLTLFKNQQLEKHISVIRTFDPEQFFKSTCNFFNINNYFKFLFTNTQMIAKKKYEFGNYLTKIRLITILKHDYIKKVYSLIISYQFISYKKLRVKKKTYLILTQEYAR